MNFIFEMASAAIWTEQRRFKGLQIFARGLRLNPPYQFEIIFLGLLSCYEPSSLFVLIQVIFCDFLVLCSLWIMKTLSIDDATTQLVPRCYRFKMPCFEEQDVNIYIFKSLYRQQSFEQKSLAGHSCNAASIVSANYWIKKYEILVKRTCRQSWR